MNRVFPVITKLVDWSIRKVFSATVMCHRFEVTNTFHRIVDLFVQGIVRVKREVANLLNAVNTKILQSFTKTNT